MRIDDDHRHYGSALIQIAEDPNFTSINALKIGGEIIPNVYRINDSIGVYLKYSSKPVSRYNQYSFNFSQAILAELDIANDQLDKLFMGLVCVQDREICCLSYTQLKDLISRRKKVKTDAENQYTILVSILKGASLRAYINYPGTKNNSIGKEMVISRKDFPNTIFL